MWRLFKRNKVSQSNCQRIRDGKRGCALIVSWPNVIKPEVIRSLTTRIPTIDIPSLVYRSELTMEHAKDFKDSSKLCCSSWIWTSLQSIKWGKPLKRHWMTISIIIRKRDPRQDMRTGQKRTAWAKWTYGSSNRTSEPVKKYWDDIGSKKRHRLEQIAAEIKKQPSPLWIGLINRRDYMYFLCLLD